MNARQLELFQNLENLVSTNEAFFRQTFELDGKVYWIYNYRLASYSVFQFPDAMEARGIMFEVTYSGEPIRLAAWPMAKFFNLNENPSTMGLDLSTAVSITDKADGSLISTFMHNGNLLLKSKGSLFSEQAVDALSWLNRSENNYYKQLLTDFTANGITVNLEWVSPNNRIVLGYLEPNLLVLNTRSTETGEYVDTWILHDHVVKSVDLKGLDIVDFVASIPDMTDDIEGYVVKLSNGLWFKCKTLKYLKLHHCKDSINNPRRLFEAILGETVDDLRSLFYDDQLAIKQINEMEEKVDKIYNHSVTLVENFYETNKTLDRKSYAIKGQSEVEQLYFGLVMTRYLQQPVDYKGFLTKKYREFGFRDESLVRME